MTDRQAQELYQLVTGRPAPSLADAAAALKERFSADDLADGSAVSAYRGEFVWAIQSSKHPHLYVDDEPAAAMTPLPGDLWMHARRVRTGTSHAHYYRVGGSILGGKRFDTAAYGEDSYSQDGVPRGELSEELFHESPTYRGWKVSYWLYASPGVDPSVPSAVMVWQDGHRF